MKRTILITILIALSISAIGQTNAKSGLRVGNYKVSGSNITLLDSIAKINDKIYFFIGADTGSLGVLASDIVDLFDIALKKYADTTHVTTVDYAPTVYSNNPVIINSASATIGGNVTSDGGAVITIRGLVYGLTANPTTSNWNIPFTGTTGAFSTTLVNLTKGTTYYVRSYATNSEGTAYGTNVSFTTPALGIIQSGGKTLFYNGKQIKY